jgi:hypothetical protein
MGEIVAERLFRNSDSKAPVTARIYVPEKMGQSSEWSCKITVEGLDAPFEQTIIGVDSFQALYLALRRLCVHLEKYEGTLTFLDGAVGDCGFPLIVPWNFGCSLRAEVYQLIERKIEEHLNSRSRMSE